MTVQARTGQGNERKDKEAALSDTACTILFITLGSVVCSGDISSAPITLLE